MSFSSGLWATLAAALPLLAAAPFVAAAAYVLVWLFKASARERAPHAAGEPASDVIPAAFACAADSFDTAGSPPLGTVARRAHDELLAREVSFEKLRRAGEGAPARILNLTDTGIRIGDGASMLRFGLEVLPTGRPAFRAETQCAVPDTTRTKFAPGATVNVKFGVYGSPQVAVDYAP
ncbi:MAG TPA: hypothetical protein VF659_01810 [Pyrinomonadaceae bacterium]|jgi:hypothetical protein